MLLNVFCGGIAQNIQVSTNTFTPQELVEDLLINSGCIQNIQVTNTVGGNFSGTDESYGYFNANGSTFPFAEGIVLSTGRLSNVPGPNNSLSDDDAPGWIGDTDLEIALNVSNTTNATILEFDFIPNADNVRFRYLFASEEYQEGDPNTCRFSDAFAFLIRPVGGDYTNIALVPGTQTPVLVTTVHPEIPGGCPAINETYFGSFNGVDVPINFNGQTTILTAESPVIPNQPYHIKLVIADEENFRFDSAVFLEANSFNISANLGDDRSFVNGNPICFDEPFTLDATPTNLTPDGYQWFKNGVLQAETSGQFDVTMNETATYSVEVDYGNGCFGNDEIVIDYTDEIIATNAELFQCEEISDGIAFFNLFDIAGVVTSTDNTLIIENFYTRRQDAEIAFDPIPNPTNYTNPTPNQVVFVRVENPFGCFDIASVILRTTTNTFGPYELSACSDMDNPNRATYDLTEITTQIENEVTTNVDVSYHRTVRDAVNADNVLPLVYTQNEAGAQQIYARVSGMTGCEGIAEITLTIVPTPQFEAQEAVVYCIDTFPETVPISSGVIGDTTDFTYLWNIGETTETIAINAAGTYTVEVTRTETIGGITYTCSATNTIVVTESEIPQFTGEVTPGFGNESTITVTVMGIGDYEFALDDANGFYQDSNVFTNVLGGVHTVYVRDKNGCGIASATVYVLDFPQFVTPNNDGFHDTWQVSGLNMGNLQINRVTIFDRYGKLLTVLSPNDTGWDGTYNGAPVPSSDYWFVAYFEGGGSYRSHFTLKR